MNGLLKFEGEVPKIGSRVLIFVNFDVKPSGIWFGRLEAIEGKIYAGTDITQKDLEAKIVGCRAIIIDTKVDARKHNSQSNPDSEFMNAEPRGGYIAYPDSSAIRFLLPRLREEQKEKAGLKRRLEIERETWHAAFRAITSNEAFTQFKDLLEDFLRRLTGAEHT